jgi:hypothetical protein
MLSKDQVFEKYGHLDLQHHPEEDCCHRFVFSAIAPDGNLIHVIYSPTIDIWEEYVKTDRPVHLDEAPEYHLCEVIHDGRVEFEEMQAPVF